MCKHKIVNNFNNNYSTLEGTFSNKIPDLKNYTEDLDLFENTRYIRMFLAEETQIIEIIKKFKMQKISKNRTNTCRELKEIAYETTEPLIFVINSCIDTG